MKAQDVVPLLRTLREECVALPLLSVSSAQFSAWETKLRSVLIKALGETHHITSSFQKVSWTPWFEPAPREDMVKTFERARSISIGLVDAAIFELEHLAAVTDVVADAGFDPELWAYVGGHVVAEEWATVASQTAIFTEDRIRKWAGRKAEEIGERLMTAVFGDGGDYRLGLTQGEKQGWHRLAMGLSMALRNADAHRIQSRADHKLYAMGVVGASSLLLTQMRFEHANRFHDMSPAGLSEFGVPTGT
ncbi:TIGR02391 family protein [Micromonospora sp. CPCC 205558]|uniref:TIGR02391 family protein n=1 Tax=Micromonospora sp. CPCC 205558 TaxID=3122403 RepID=UPI002FF14AFB